jgi:hypothetical protein
MISIAPVSASIVSHFPLFSADSVCSMVLLGLPKKLLYGKRRQPTG